MIQKIPEVMVSFFPELILPCKGYLDRYGKMQYKLV